MKHISFLKNGLSGFQLKILACTFMLIDHIGYMLLPRLEILRVIGRLAFPLFAYLIAEGCRYTRNKLRRFLSVFILGLLCECSYFLFVGKLTGNILLTFSASVLLIYQLSYTKKILLKNVKLGLVHSMLFLMSLFVVKVCCEFLYFDYGFFGAITPVLVVLFDDMGVWSDKLYKTIDRKLVSLSMFSLGLLLVALFEVSMDCQIYSLLSVLLLMFYNGKKGKYSFKYGFYLFYPLHFIVLQAVDYLVK